MWKIVRKLPAPLRSIRIVIRVLNRRIESAALLSRSAEIAFELLACTIPLLVLITSIGSQFVEVELIHDAIRGLLEQFLPPSAHASNLIANVPAEVETVFSYRAAAAWITAPLLIWISSAPSRALREGLNQIFRTPKSPAGAKASSRAVGLKSILRAVTFPVVTALAIVAVTLLKPLLAILEERLPLEWLAWEGGILGGITIPLVSLCATVLLCACCYKFLPDHSIPRSVVLTSTIIAVVLWEIARRVFAYYLKLTPTFGLFYGGHVVLAAFGLWLYCSALIVLISALLGQYIGDLRSGRCSLRAQHGRRHSTRNARA